MKVESKSQLEEANISEDGEERNQERKNIQPISLFILYQHLRLGRYRPLPLCRAKVSKERGKQLLLFRVNCFPFNSLIFIGGDNYTPVGQKGGVSAGRQVL